MKELSETLLGSFYKKCKTNGKMELFGIDGANHGFYSLVATAIAGFISFSFPLFIAIVIMSITSSVIIVVFFMIERGQEESRLKRRHLTGDADKWYHSKNAQRNDFLIPSATTLIVTAIVLFLRFH